MLSGHRLEQKNASILTLLLFCACQDPNAGILNSYHYIYTHTR